MFSHYHPIGEKNTGLLPEMIQEICQRLEIDDCWNLLSTNRRLHSFITSNNFRLVIEKTISDRLDQYQLGPITIDSEFHAIKNQHKIRLLRALQFPVNNTEFIKSFIEWLIQDEIKEISNFSFWEIAIAILLKDLGCHYVNSSSKRLINSTPVLKEIFQLDISLDNQAFETKITNHAQLRWIKRLINSIYYHGGTFHLSFKNKQTRHGDDYRNLNRENILDNNDLKSIKWMFEFVQNKKLHNNSLITIDKEKLCDALLKGNNVNSLTEKQLEKLNELNPWLSVYFSRILAREINAPSSDLCIPILSYASHNRNIVDAVSSIMFDLTHPLLIKGILERLDIKEIPSTSIRCFITRYCLNLNAFHIHKLLNSIEEVCSLFESDIMGRINKSLHSLAIILYLIHTQDTQKKYIDDLVYLYIYWLVVNTAFKPDFIETLESRIIKLITGTSGRIKRIESINNKLDDVFHPLVLNASVLLDCIGLSPIVAETMLSNLDRSFLIFYSNIINKILTQESAHHFIHDLNDKVIIIADFYNRIRRLHFHNIYNINFETFFICRIEMIFSRYPNQLSALNDELLKSIMRYELNIDCFGTEHKLEALEHLLADPLLVSFFSKMPNSVLNKLTSCQYIREFNASFYTPEQRRLYVLIAHGALIAKKEPRGAKKYWYLTEFNIDNIESTSLVMLPHGFLTPDGTHSLFDLIASLLHVLDDSIDKDTSLFKILFEILKTLLNEPDKSLIARTLGRFNNFADLLQRPNDFFEFKTDEFVASFLVKDEDRPPVVNPNSFFTSHDSTPDQSRIRAREEGDINEGAPATKRSRTG